MQQARLLFCVALITIMAAGPALTAEKILKMSTTTSTQSSGLLDVLLPALEKDTGIKIKVIAKGTGAAIRDGMDGNVDVIFVHDPAREETFVKDGYGTQRYAVMHNDFVIIGPPNDPAKVNGLNNGPAALKAIADAKATFISRGDDSGTHTKEQSIWKKSGVALEETVATVTKEDGKKAEVKSVHPANATWYLSVGQGMGKTLTIADEKQAYTLTDRGTYIKYKFGKDVPLGLEILCEGDASLTNPYGVIPVNPKKFPNIQFALAKEFAEWLVSPKGQKVIADYRLLDKQLFFPDAQ